MFALAASNFSTLSQTFVRQHAEKIAPGQSVFVSHGRFSGPPLPGPLLYNLHRNPKLVGSDAAIGALALFQPRTQVISRFLRHHGATTMMTEFGTYGVVMHAAAKRAGCRHFVHFHGWDASSALRDPKYQKACRTLFAEAAGFFAPSRYIADRLIDAGCPPDAIWVTPCGVAIDDFPLSTRAPNRCIAIGRFIEKKAPLVTVAAFAAAAKDTPDAHLDYIGDGPMLDQAQALAVSEGVGNKITFHGAQPHAVVRDLMGRASIFLQHSVTASDGNVEGLPVAILEAMCSGLAVVSTLHSGIPEAVLDGETGLLVKEHDTSAMAQAIGQLMGDPARVAAMGDAGHARAVDQFSIDRSVAILRDKMGLS